MPSERTGQSGTTSKWASGRALAPRADEPRTPFGVAARHRRLRCSGELGEAPDTSPNCQGSNVSSSRGSSGGTRGPGGWACARVWRYASGWPPSPGSTTGRVRSRVSGRSKRISPAPPSPRNAAERRGGSPSSAAPVTCCRPGCCAADPGTGAATVTGGLLGPGSDRVRGGVVEVHLTVEELRRFAADPALGRWHGVLAEIAGQWARRDELRAGWPPTPTPASSAGPWLITSGLVTATAAGRAAPDPSAPPTSTTPVITAGAGEPWRRTPGRAATGTTRTRIAGGR
jgi:hypothetical protein